MSVILNIIITIACIIGGLAVLVGGIVYMQLSKEMSEQKRHEIGIKAPRRSE